LLVNAHAYHLTAKRRKSKMDTDHAAIARRRDCRTDPTVHKEEAILDHAANRRPLQRIHE